MPTRKQISDLKQNWESDPCWDIEETEGFEEHKEELLKFRLEKEAEWKDKCCFCGTTGALVKLHQGWCCIPCFKNLESHDSSVDSSVNDAGLAYVGRKHKGKKVRILILSDEGLASIVPK